MLMPIYSQYVGPQKVDICFYDTLKDQIYGHKCAMGFYMVRFLSSASFFIAHLLRKDPNDQNTSRMVTWLFVMILVFNLAAFIYSLWVYRKFLMNAMLMYAIAEKIQHVQFIDDNNLDDLGSWEEPIPNMGLKVSKLCYQFENNILTSDVDQEYKKRAKRNCDNLFNQHLNVNKGIRFWTQTLNLASVSKFTFAIILLCEGKGISATEDTFISVYLFSEVCSRLLIYVILFLIGISPVICLFCCIYACFCTKQSTIVLPETQQATVDIIKECEGNCPVCFQDIKLTEKVIVLKCSTKHVFHELCIKGWTKLRKNTCPVCRAII